MRIVLLRIHGRVQGVGYRAFVEYEAARWKLEGWVRNRRDGSVEAAIAGDKALVETMIAACRRGPAAGRVEQVDVTETDATVLASRVPGEQFSVLQTV